MLDWGGSADEVEGGFGELRVDEADEEFNNRSDGGTESVAFVGARTGCSDTGAFRGLSVSRETT